MILLKIKLTNGVLTAKYIPERKYKQITHYSAHQENSNLSYKC